MARKNRLQELAKERGKSEQWYIDHVVVPLCNANGQSEAARQLGVSQASISNWLKDRYVPQVWWTRKMTPEDEASINRVIARNETRLTEEEHAS